MATATLDTPTAPATRRRRRAADNPNAGSKRLERAFRAWAAAIAALTAASEACDELAESLGDLRVGESDPFSGDDVREDAWHTAWTVRTYLGLIESNAPHAVTEMARRAS